MATPITLGVFRKGIRDLLDEVYGKAFNELRLVMLRRGRYQVWRGHHTLVADRIKHRKQALALIKLIKGNDEYDIR